MDPALSPLPTPPSIDPAALDETIDTSRMWYDMIWPALSNAALGFLILSAGWFISRWAERFLRNALVRSHIDEAIARFLASIIRYVLLVATVVTALGRLGIETTSVVAVFASAGLAIGLALQGSLSNFASGVLILFFRPFRLGDVVVAGGQTGRVADIGLFTTALVTTENFRIAVPNASVTGGIITNQTVLETRRLEVELAIPFGPEPAKIEELLQGVVASTHGVIADPRPIVWFAELGAKILKFRVSFWAPSEAHGAVSHDVRMAIYRALGEAGTPLDAIALK